MHSPSTQRVAHNGRAQTGGSSLNSYTLLIAIVGAAVGLLFGFDIAVINGAMVFVRQQFALSNIQTEIAASSLLAGCVIGASLAGFLSASSKPLLLASSGGMALSLIVMGLAFRPAPPSAVTFTVAMFSYVFCYSFGLAPVVWVLLAELFPTSTRGRAMAISTVALWLACLLLTATFLSLVELFGPSNTFWLYGAISVCTFGFVFCCVPETKGKSLELIERMWT